MTYIQQLVGEILMYVDLITMLYPYQNILRQRNTDPESLELVRNVLTYTSKTRYLSVSVLMEEEKFSCP